MQNDGISARSPPLSIARASVINVVNVNIQRTISERKQTMKVLYINNDLGGFADYLDIAENTTVEKFFKQQLPGRQAEDYLIRINRQPVARDYVLQEGDRITATPTKIEGAA